MSENFKIIATVKTHEQASIVLSYPNTILRINSSHMETQPLVQFIQELTIKYPSTEIFIDLQGSKIRISRNQPQLTLKKGQKIKLTIDEPTPNTKSIHIGNPNTIKLLSKGTKVKIDDGRIELIIDSIENESNAIGIVIKEGILRPGKGFNLYPHPFIQNQLSKRDIEIVENLKNFNNVKFALSFVSVPEEILDLKKRTNCKFVAAKIEREMTQEQVKAICKVCDSVWICRGDMGVQMGFVGMTKFVREFTKNYIPNLKVPCIIAGEVMEHLCEHNTPTRTEICYSTNCILDGFKGMVLSDETVFGKYPKETMDFCYNYINDFFESESNNDAGNKNIYDNKNFNKKKVIENITTGKEEPFCFIKNKDFKNITIIGNEENEKGKYSFNECKNITVENSNFFSRYAFWNCYNLTIKDSIFNDTSIFPLCNCTNIEIYNSRILNEQGGRNCTNLTIKDSYLNSIDFGLKSDRILLEKNIIFGKNIFGNCSNISIKFCEIFGRNAFDGVQNLNIYDSNLNEKCCLSFSKNIFCKNCKINGENFGRFCENAIFENCYFYNCIRPFVHCKKLKLSNCIMDNAYLPFEFSDVNADIHSHIDKINNKFYGKIIVDSYGEYIKDEDNGFNCNGIIEVRSKN